MLMAVFILGGQVGIATASFRTPNVLADLVSSGFTIQKKIPQVISKTAYIANMFVGWGEEFAVSLLLKYNRTLHSSPQVRLLQVMLSLFGGLGSSIEIICG
jgi:hypothetical protein